MRRIATLSWRALLVQFATLCLCHAASAAIYVFIPNVSGDVSIKGYEGAFLAHGFELAAPGSESDGSGTRSATLPTISLTFDTSPSAAKLLEAALEGGSLDDVAIEVTRDTADGQQLVYLLELERSQVKGFEMSAAEDDSQRARGRLILEILTFGLYDDDPGCLACQPSG
jgi:type VI protein secretion system component Hcp